MKRIFLMFLMLVLSVSLSGLLAACNTTKGVGQDMKAGGQSLENAAKDHGATQ